MDYLGGYRLLRAIGVGSRAEVFLAHPVRPDAELATAVIKVYGPAVTDESVFAEVEALTRAAGEHVVRLLDVAATAEGAPALILSRHAAGSLARLLADRTDLALGEAITVLAPIATALGRMHAAGIAHGGISPGAILFDANGSPTLACFGRATLLAPGLPAALLEVEQAVLTDVLAFGGLAATVLERAGRPDVAARVRSEAAPGAWLTAFDDELFDPAEPLPVGLGARTAVEHVPLPSRVIAPSAVLQPEPAAVPRWEALLARGRGSLRAVRRPVWISAGVGALALLVAVVAVPAGESGAQHSALPTAVPIVPTSAAEVVGDDPVAAAPVLLAAREECIRALSTECLDAVDQPGSSAHAADLEVVKLVLDGTEIPGAIIAGAVQLTQRLGDSALVSLGPDAEPASLLLVKGEAGWRIRDYLEE